MEVFLKEINQGYLRYWANQHNVRDFVNRLVLSSSVYWLGTDKLNQFRGVTRNSDYHNSHENNDADLSLECGDHRVVANDRYSRHDEEKVLIERILEDYQSIYKCDIAFS